MSGYQEYSEVPAFEHAIFEGGKVTNPPGKFLWSSKLEPPAIGDWTYFRGNNIGPAVVVGYFTEDNWMGCLVKPVAPPRWYIEQKKIDKGMGTTCHAFGVDHTPMEPMVEGEGALTAKQRNALIDYAIQHGDDWKESLLNDWLKAGSRTYRGEWAYLQQVRNSLGPSWLRSTSLEDIELRWNQPIEADHDEAVDAGPGPRR